MLRASWGEVKLERLQLGSLMDGHLPNHESRFMPKPDGPDDVSGYVPPYVPTEGDGPATDAVDFFLSPNAINSITSMLNPMAR